ncbi:Delta 8 Fatty Acid Desaturase [Perkinsus olseni]|uniref:Delta 8 Fatty Acid Desaturase n=1 Tax=Perkinsus olseni TaxID=32597 RepID=A0A7J6NIZ8_PEROL|nr:Delta 8 Fatty Acid Desaturase [Perkinsus olseni]
MRLLGLLLLLPAVILAVRRRHHHRTSSLLQQKSVAPVDSPDARVLERDTPRLMSTGIEEELPQSAYKPEVSMAASGRILSPETKAQLGFFSRMLARLGAESGQLHTPARSEDISKFMNFRQTKCCAPEVKGFDAFAESEGQPVRAENISVNLQQLRAVNLDGEADLVSGLPCFMSLSISSISQFIVGVAVTLQFADVITGHLKKNTPTSAAESENPWLNALWRPYRLNVLPDRVGAMFHDRALNAHQNWERHFRRSVVEAGVAVASSWAAANHLSAGIPLSVAIGITAAIWSVVICHSLDIFAGVEVDSRPAAAAAAGKDNATDRDAREDKETDREELSSEVVESQPKSRKSRDSSSSAELPLYTWEEVARHASRESCWIVVDGFVYDLTNWLDRHPGGILPILNCAGDVDATDVFIANHPPKVVKRILPAFKIGRLQGYTVSPVTAEFRKLVSDMEASGWFNTDLTYYLGLGVWYALLLGASIYSVVALQSAVLGGFLMGLVWQQAAFTGHDLGHNAVFHEKARDDRWAVFLGNFLGGISIGWCTMWLPTRYRLIPDIQHMPVLAVSEKIAVPQDEVHKTKGFWSTYHEKYFPLDSVAKKVLPRQHYLYYIVMLFARFNLYLQSVLLLTADKRTRLMKGVKSPKWELCALAGFATWYIYLVTFLPSPASRIAFVLLSHSVAGVLHIQITLSHFAMPTYEVSQRPLKLKTSLDITCPWWMDWFHGGLQFQAAHHVFPRSPRHRARQLSIIIKNFCMRHGMKYNEVGFLEANRMVLKTLSNVALDTHNYITEMANLQG